ncbi:hypothetical protein ACFL04_04150 [Patescibacteria group bacterium]
MNRILQLVVVLLLSPMAVTAGEAVSDTLVIQLSPGDPGLDIDPATVDWPADFARQIELVNSGLAEFYCEVSTDTTKWRDAKAQRKVSANVDWFNAMYDGGETGARMQSVVNLLKSRGLKRLAVRYIPSRELTCYAKVYAVPSTPTVVEKTTVIEKSITNVDTTLISLSLMGGLARTAIVDLVPIVVGTIIYDGRFLLQAHFGHSLFTSDRSIPIIGGVDTFNRVSGARAGIRLIEPLWLTAGVFQEENLIRTPREFGDSRLYRYRAGEIGLMVVEKYFSAFVTVTHGYDKHWQESADDHLAVRFGAVFGKTWGWQ